MALTYPVDLNKRYTFWDIGQGRPFNDGAGRPITNRTWPVSDGGEVLNLPPDVKWLLDIRDPQPAYNEATQKLERTGPTEDLVAETYTYGWNVVALTQAELDAKTEQSEHGGREPGTGIMTKLLNGNASGAETQRAVAWCIRELQGPQG
jgi:hypothetical protein